MNKIDYSFTGGFPLDQEVLDFMQSAYLDGFKAIFAEAGTTPIILSGMVNLNTPTPTITAGYFYYNGEVYSFPGGAAIGSPVPPIAVCINMGNTPTSAAFEDGSSHPIYRQRAGSLTLAVPDVANIDYDTFRTWHDVFGLRASADPFRSFSVSVSGGFATGTIYYKKNWLMNTLHLKGSIAVASTGSTPAIPAIYYGIGAALPVECRPATDVPFSLYYRYHGAPIQDSAGIDNILSLNGELRTTGDLSVGFIRTSTPTTYTVSFNTIIPLD